MIERKLAEKFRKLYTENSVRLSDYEKQLFTTSDPFDWVQLMSERSYVMREIYAENEELMSELWDNCSEEITPEEAELLYDLAIGFFFDGHHDFAVLTEFCERILPVFEDMGEPEFLVAIYHVLASEYASFYRTVSDKKGMDVAMHYFRKVIEQSDNISKISTPEIREFIYEDYFNLISYLGNFYYKVQSCSMESITVFEKLRNLWNSDFVQQNDAENENVKRFVQSADDAFLAKNMHYDLFSKEERERYIKLIEDMSNRAMTEGGEVEGSPNYRICITYKYLTGQVTPEEILSTIIKSINEIIPVPDYKGDDTEALQLIMRHFKYACTAIMVIRTMDAPDVIKEEWADKFLPKSMEILGKVPYQFFTGTMLPVCAEWYHAAEPILTGELNKVQFLMHMIVRRQPFTYIHSRLVANIASLIGQEVLDTHPEAFVGVRGTTSVEEVQKNRAYLLSFITISGLVHDIGKCYIPSVVNRQNRSLTNTEYATIRKHSEIGYREAQDNAALKPYSDVIIGHHKHYDGLHGYPLGYDNNESTIKIIIDIISIADSIEAGTDTLTRSYTQGKDFAKLLKELKQDAGTRYNPMIVEVIENNPDLIEKLSDLTGQGRYDICYKAMQDILSIDADKA
ncbi:HD-GYP domain-containing protein [Butyrivibrio sp. NC2002]|uniref:HD-GYP domain-containing protein n=1 Tax=Butyrivibrio sp. NC2002 TaxID=1410610 RepID=UPI000560F6B3|nr:HD domain-containing phosphohydrolase [Butyrivibrio sp. NC2002]